MARGEDEAEQASKAHKIIRRSLSNNTYQSLSPEQKLIGRTGRRTDNLSSDLEVFEYETRTTTHRPGHTVCSAALSGELGSSNSSRTTPSASSLTPSSKLTPSPSTSSSSSASLSPGVAPSYTKAGAEAGKSGNSNCGVRGELTATCSDASPSPPRCCCCGDNSCSCCCCSRVTCSPSDSLGRPGSVSLDASARGDAVHRNP